MFAKWLKFIKTDTWRIRPKDHSRGKSFVIRLVQIIVLAVCGFDENNCKLKASALTFYSLLSIVPIIAVMFGIAKGFDLQTQVEEQLLAKMEGQKEVVTKIIDQCPFEEPVVVTGCWVESVSIKSVQICVNLWLR
jgi:membrane protein